VRPLIFGISMLLFICTGCMSAPEPVGPAERIGKSLDELTRGVREFGETWDTGTRARNRGSDWTTKEKQRSADDWRDPEFDESTKEDIETEPKRYPQPNRYDFDYSRE
jgi:hypothetical protein